MKSLTIIFVFLIAIASSESLASPKSKPNWQQHEILAYDFFMAQKENGGTANFPSIFVFNHKNQLTGVTLKANSGLFENINFHNLPTRALPINNKFEGVLGIIKPLLDTSTKSKGSHSVVLIMPSKTMVNCPPCTDAFNKLNKLYVDNPNKSVHLKLVTAVTKSLDL